MNDKPTRMSGNSARSASHISAWRRRGITILEVLVSIGLIAIGLFGVFALLPVASFQAQQGLTEDNKTAYGHAAFNAFDIRGMRNTALWTNVSGSAVFAPNAWQSFCIDPRFVAANAGTAGHDVFPYVTGAPIRMQRITLRAAPRGGPMSKPLADYIFQTTDDLSFIRQPNVVSPRQEMTSTGQKRQSSGDISWMATVVPKFEMGRPPLPGTVPQSDLYTLSVVVMFQRDAALSMNASTATQIANERIAQVMFLGGGVGGGDVQLVGAAPTDVAVRAGDWLMLSQEVPVVDFDPMGRPVNVTRAVHKWYRVIAGDITPGSNTREVTLQGPDWNPALPTQATIVTGAVAVYEKTIRLESSSLWTY